MTSHVHVAALTHIGRVRRKNEDAYVVADLSNNSLMDKEQTEGQIGAARFDVGERGVLLAVSDGMGGAQAGDVASAIVVDTLTREIGDAEMETPRDTMLVDAIRHAHEAVRKRGKKDHATMGATLTAVFVRGSRAYVAEVGDSRAYLLRNGTLAQITHDQSMVQLLVDHGVMDEEEASNSPMRNVILQAMGHQRELEIAIGRLELRDRDCLILCSDGLTTHVNDEEIRDTLLSGAPEEAAQKLVDLANSRGGNDNITVIVAGIAGGLERPSKTEDPHQAVEVIAEYDMKMPVRH